MPRWFTNLGIVTTLPAPTIDLDFTTGTYQQGGSGISLSSVLTISRASTAYAKTSTGTLTSFGTDTFRITGLGLLAEDARTNLALQSQTLATTWTATNVTVTSDSTAAPDGTTTADKVIDTATGGSIVHSLSQNITLTAAAYTWSIYVKAAELNFAWLKAAFSGTTDFTMVVNLTTGSTTSTNTVGSPANVSSAVETLGSGWFRLTITGDATAAGTSMTFGPSNTGTPSYNASGDVLDTSTGTNGVHCWGAQVELGSWISSYVPTTTTSVTRAQDVVEGAGALDTILTAATCSVLVDFIEEANVPAGFSRRLVASALGNGSALLIEINDFQASTRNAADPDLATGIFPSALFTTGVKIAMGQSPSGRSIAGPGVSTTTDAFVDTILSPVTLGREPGGPHQVFGYFRRLSAWNSRLSDAELQSITT